MINTFLLSLRPSQQVGLLFVLLFGILAAVSTYAFVSSLRERPEGDPRIQALKDFTVFASTDFLDDVSGKYAAVTVIDKERGPAAAALSDRTLTPKNEDNINMNVGRPRGNPNRKDWYSFVGITIAWRIDDSKGTCPSFK